MLPFNRGHGVEGFSRPLKEMNMDNGFLFLKKMYALIMFFLSKNLYNKATGNSNCGCEGKICPKKKKMVM
jgi:hypothetical protein